MTVINFTPRIRGAKYTGSNTAEVLSLFAEHAAQDGCTPSVKSSSGGLLTLQHNPQGGTNQDLCTCQTGRSIVMNGTDFFAYDISDADLAYYLRADSALMTDAGGNTGQRVLAAKTVTIPAAVSLAAGTRTVAVAWPYTLPTAAYAVDICPDAVLSIGSPYTFAIASSPAPTAAGCTLAYTNSALIVSLGAGTIDLYPRA